MCRFYAESRNLDDVSTLKNKSGKHAAGTLSHLCNTGTPAPCHWSLSLAEADKIQQRRTKPQNNLSSMLIITSNETGLCYGDVTETHYGVYVKARKTDDRLANVPRPESIRARRRQTYTYRSGNNAVSFPCSDSIVCQGQSLFALSKKSMGKGNGRFDLMVFVDFEFR